jgi:Flp pilus assembly protein TadG
VELLILNKVRKTRGQAVVEFAIILPVFLALVGATTDVARVYSAWIGVQSAARNAAEYLATNPPTANVTTANAGAIAAARVSDELPSLGSFTSVAVITCTGPEVQVTYSSSPTATGASTKYPLGSATVNACLPFRPLFNYPFITQNGAWSLRVGATYQVLQNR